MILTRSGLPYLLAVAFAACAAAQQPDGVSLSASQPAATFQIPPLPQGRLSGYISCADTHRPARGAVVSISMQDREHFTKIVRTGVDGRYTADHLPPGEYIIWTYFPGYVSRQELVPGFTDPEHAAAWNKIRDSVIGRYRATLADNGNATINEVLVRGVAFSGRVLFTDGSPATQITMFVQPAESASAEKPATDASEDDDNAPTVDVLTADRDVRMEYTHQSITTDDRGYFRVAGLPPGTYTVGAALPPPDEEAHLPTHGTHGDTGLMPGTGELVIYAGKSNSTLHIAQARTYQLGAGDEARDIDITLPAEGFYTVSGLLLAPDGRPLAVGDLTLTDVTDDTISFAAAPIRRDGSFTFYNVPNGSYKLEAADASVGRLDPRITSLPRHEEWIELVPDDDEMYADASMPVLVSDMDVNNLLFTLQKAPPEPPVSSKPATTPK